MTKLKEQIVVNCMFVNYVTCTFSGRTWTTTGSQYHRMLVYIRCSLQLSGQIPCYHTVDSNCKTSRLVDHHHGQLVDVNQPFYLFP